MQNADPVELQIQLQQISQYTAKQTESTCDDARQRDIYTVRALVISTQRNAQNITYCVDIQMPIFLNIESIHDVAL